MLLIRLLLQLLTVLLTAEMASVADTQSGSFPISSQKNVIKVSPATTTSNLSKKFQIPLITS
ncbi:hypothetical protein HanHA300_Chr11g0406621 [Helianthus annuus]|nr:hypothetical protein HanHA300_Chr11g0406621 [Helianthus annuus]KAJ0517847.1 hypothetical protein HanHA89_Chr11g0430371 [Helianthus annuus]KAJ0685863.1 hypothetical protein HanLR1_Chr11g0407861 [Helianthus annuus]KAJ0689733.1 hypothetical protein HanOQP8_Chr11g0409431 [Helianthus annuus]